MPKVLFYLLTKLAAAGFTITMMFVFTYFSNGLDMFRLLETISGVDLWFIVFGYGIGCSLLIDLIALKLHFRKFNVKIVLYVISGYAFFMISAINIFDVFAGTVGAVCALVFYFATHIAREYKWFLYVFALVIPIGFLLLTNIDFTQKKNWVEDRNDFTYTASFSYFNGIHEIPLYLEEGQRFTYESDIKNRAQGGYSFYVLDEKNDYVGFIENEDNHIFEVQASGMYRIVVKGNKRENGGFKITWEIEE
ncbi:hypothetical protein [Anaerobacillus alkaliphilus]|nr:hypothetical protein [Anaerobacillus alkaliphilus]